MGLRKPSLDPFAHGVLAGVIAESSRSMAVTAQAIALAASRQGELAADLARSSV